MRESPTAYRQLPGTLVPGMFARALPTGAASGVRLTVQRAMHLCDAVRQVRPRGMRLHAGQPHDVHVHLCDAGAPRSVVLGSGRGAPAVGKA